MSVFLCAKQPQRRERKPEVSDVFIDSGALRGDMTFANFVCCTKKYDNIIVAATQETDGDMRRELR